MKRLLILAPIALTACGQTEVPVLILPPAELAQCADDPVAPDLPPVDWSSVETARPVQRARDASVLEYILQLRTSGGDCRAKVKGLATWRDEAGG